MAFRDERDGQTSIIKDLRGKPKAQGDCILPEKPKSFVPKDRLDKELKANKSRYAPQVKNIVIEGEASDEGGNEMILSPKHVSEKRRSSHQPSVFDSDRIKGFAD